MKKKELSKMIFEGSSFGRNLTMLENSMSVNRLRSNVISNNLVNANVPNFKRSEVNFESQLKRAYENELSGAYKHQINHVETRKVEFAKVLMPNDVKAMVKLDYASEVKANGNNVDLDREAAEAKKTSMTFDLLAEMVKFQINQVNQVVR